VGSGARPISDRAPLLPKVGSGARPISDRAPLLPKAIISDFGGVLTSPLSIGFFAYQEASGVTTEDLGRAMQGLAEARGENPLFELERGELSEEEFGRLLAERLPDRFDLVELRRHYFDRLEPNAPMIDYMRELRARDLRMALCTNNVREWEPLWRAKLPELDEIFECVVDSAFVGTRKPERRIFELTVQRLGDGLRLEDCLLVDDLEVNCDGARAVGMQAVRFESAEQAIKDIEALLRA
jgi:putative hydrolase of the HAD superfamily